DVVLLHELDGPAADDVEEARRLAGRPDDDGILWKELDPNAPTDALELLGGQRVEGRMLAQERGNVHRGPVSTSAPFSREGLGWAAIRCLRPRDCGPILPPGPSSR